MKPIEKKIRRVVYWLNEVMNTPKNQLQKYLLSPALWLVFCIGVIVGILGLLFSFVGTLDILFWCAKSFPVIVESPDQRYLLVYCLSKISGPNPIAIFLAYGGLLLITFIGITINWTFTLNDKFTVKLPEESIPKAEEILKRYPEAEKILLLLMEETRKNDDATDLAKILEKFDELSRFSHKKLVAQNETDKFGEKIVRLRAELGLPPEKS